MSTTLPAPPRVDIRAIRERFGLTQADIADEIHVDKRTIRRWETGEASPSPMAMAHLRQLRARLSREREQGGGQQAGGPSAAPAATAGSGNGHAAPAPARASAAGGEFSLMPRRRLPSL